MTMTTNNQTPDTEEYGWLSAEHLRRTADSVKPPRLGEVDVPRLLRAIADEKDRVITPPAEVEALIERLDAFRQRAVGFSDLHEWMGEVVMFVPECLAALRTLTARIAELEGQVGELPVGDLGDIVDEIEGFLRISPIGCTSPEWARLVSGHLQRFMVAARRVPQQLTQAAKAERAKCSERIEKMAGTLKTTAERLHSEGKFADAARYMDYSGAMLSFGKQAIAADHIEANGREQG